MEMSLAKSPNKVCFYKDLRAVSLIVWLVFFQLVTIVNFVINFFLLHTIQHTHASQMHMISQIKCVFTKIYFNRFPKGGTNRIPLV